MLKFAKSAIPGILLTVAAAAGLSACAPTVLQGDANGVVIENKSSVGVGVVGAEFGWFSARSRELALERADQHCARFGKRARLTAQNHNAFQYECFSTDEAPKPAGTKG